LSIHECDNERLMHWKRTLHVEKVAYFYNPPELVKWL